MHYMDTISLAPKNEGRLLVTYGHLQQSLTHARLFIAPEKVKRHLAFQNLRHVFYPREIKSQKLEIKKDSLQILNDFQKMLGDNKLAGTLFKVVYRNH